MWVDSEEKERRSESMKDGKPKWGGKRRNDAGNLLYFLSPVLFCLFLISSGFIVSRVRHTCALHLLLLRNLRSRIDVCGFFG
jgi:hypothetical protein